MRFPLASCRQHPSIFAEMGFAEMGFAEMGFAEMGFAEMGFAEMGSSCRKAPLAAR